MKHSQWAQVDISKAFAQSDLVHSRDRVSDRVPDFVGINDLKYAGHIAISNKSDVSESGLKIDDPEFSQFKPKIRPGFKAWPNVYAVGLNRPLYGSHDAPLRWHLAIAKALIRGGC